MHAAGCVPDCPLFIALRSKSLLKAQYLFTNIPFHCAFVYYLIDKHGSIFTGMFTGMPVPNKIILFLKRYSY